MTKLIYTEVLHINNNRWQLEIYQEEDSDALLEFVMDLLGYPELDIIIQKHSLQECLNEIETVYSINK